MGTLKALEHSKFLDGAFLGQIAQMVRRQKELLLQIESNYIEDIKLENCVRLLNSWEDGDSRNNTPLHLATMHQSCHCIHHFLSLGADFQRPNFFYWIPPNLANTPSTIAVGPCHAGLQAVLPAAARVRPPQEGVLLEDAVAQGQESR